MYTCRFVRFVSLFCLIALSASAQTISTNSGSTPTRDPQAVALVQQALAALTGGLPVTDVTLTGTARRIAGSDDESGTATLVATSAGDSKVSLNLPAGVRTEIRNHAALPLPGVIPPNSPAAALGVQSVGAWSGPEGTLQGVATHNVMTDAAWFFPAFTLANLARQNYMLSYIGQETLSNGQAVFHVSGSRPVVMPSSPSGAASPIPPLEPLLEHLSRMDLYLDATSTLPIVLAFNVHPDGNALVDIPVQIQFSTPSFSLAVTLSVSTSAGRSTTRMIWSAQVSE
jgi:hypothetical protein